MGNNGEKENQQPKDIKYFDPVRRRFIKNTGLLIGGLAGGSLFQGVFSNFASKDTMDKPENIVDVISPTEARMFFTRFEDFIVLVHATECIYPKDDSGPGAIELGVPYFIDKQLAGTWGMNSKDYRHAPFRVVHPPQDLSQLTRGEIFINGLRKMNEISQDRYDTTFDKIEETQQIEILQSFETGEVEMVGIASYSFFMLLRDATIEGVYSDPLYGGNKNMEGWKMKEFPGPVASYTTVIDKENFVIMDPISLTDYHQK